LVLFSLESSQSNQTKSYSYNQTKSPGSCSIRPSHLGPVQHIELLEPTRSRQLDWEKHQPDHAPPGSCSTQRGPNHLKSNQTEFGSTNKTISSRVLFNLDQWSCCSRHQGPVDFFISKSTSTSSPMLSAKHIVYYHCACVLAYFQSIFKG
jgi:hypothetical protein